NVSYVSDATIEKTDKKYSVGITQTHHSYEGRPIIHEYTFEEFGKDPNHLLKERGSEIGGYAHIAWVEEGKEHGGGGHGKKEYIADKETEEGFREHGTMYPQHEYPGIHWGMSVDLTSCIGCGACVIGCQAENNVSVVGKTHVIKSQE